VTTRPRPVSYRSLEVHRPAQPDARQGVSNSARASFAQMLRARRSPEPVAGAWHDEALDVAHIEPLAAFRDGGGEGGGQHDDAQQQHAPDDDADWARALVPTSDTLGELMAEGARVAAARVEAAGPVESIAHTIAGFCNERAVADSEGWSVRIALRPDVIESTTLEMTVSSHWLQLRFTTGSERSRRLLCEQEPELRRQLAASLDRQREIAVAIE